MLFEMIALMFNFVNRELGNRQEKKEIGCLPGNVFGRTDVDWTSAC